MDRSTELYDHLSRVKDPEIPVLSLHDMGILRGVSVLDPSDARAVEAKRNWAEMHPDAPEENDDHVYLITISPTYVGCPAMDRMEQDIREAMYVKQLPFVVHQQLQPSWTTDWISPEGLRKMEEYGIAPPVKGTADKRTLFAEPPKVGCPRCKSGDTRMLSLHGSTACKSQYVCNSCLEPFEYFKCL
jgi:ring-1,2-phenylacetyl-CoA epoxidase subunit PaaD